MNNRSTTLAVKTHDADVDVAHSVEDNFRRRLHDSNARLLNGYWIGTVVEVVAVIHRGILTGRPAAPVNLEFFVVRIHRHTAAALRVYTAAGRCVIVINLVIVEINKNIGTVLAAVFLAVNNIRRVTRFEHLPARGIDPQEDAEKA